MWLQSTSLAHCPSPPKAEWKVTVFVVLYIAWVICLHLYRVQDTYPGSDSIVVVQFNKLNPQWQCQKTDPLIQSSPIPSSFTAKPLVPARMSLTMGTICNWWKTMQLCHQEENLDTLDAVTHLRRDCVKLLNSDCGTYSFQEGAV